MSFGIMGGNMQPQAHLQTIVRMLAHRQQPQAACDAPRWRFNEGKLEINVEATMAAATVSGLVERGHRGRGDPGQLPGLRRRPVHLAPRRSGGRGLRRGQRPAPRRPGGRLLVRGAQHRVGGRVDRDRARRSRRRRRPRPPRSVAGPGAGDGRLDRVLGQGDHRQARLPLRRRRGDADHVPHAVRAAAVRAARLVGRARPAGADAARLARRHRPRLLRLLPGELPRLRRPGLHHAPASSG